MSTQTWRVVGGGLRLLDRPVDEGGIYFTRIIGRYGFVVGHDEVDDTDYPLTIVMPVCRSRLDILTPDLFPTEDLECPCGKLPETHWFVKYQEVQRVA